MPDRVKPETERSGRESRLAPQAGRTRATRDGARRVGPTFKQTEEPAAPAEAEVSKPGRSWVSPAVSLPAGGSADRSRLRVQALRAAATGQLGVVHRSVGALDGPVDIVGSGAQRDPGRETVGVI